MQHVRVFQIYRHDSEASYLKDYYNMLNHLNFDLKLSAPLDTAVPIATIDDTFAYEGARIHFKVSG